MNYYEAAWERWDRADEHRKALAVIWNDFIGSHPFDFGLNPTGDGATVLQVWLERPTPARFAVVLGEWLYNLRSALDYTVWATAVHDAEQDPPPGEDSLQFPIYESAEKWKRNLFRIKPLLPRHREMLLALQPFNSDPDANYLGWINRLARIDRHRRLVDGTARIAELNPALGIPSGREIEVFWGDRVLTQGTADVLLIRTSDGEELEGLRVNPRAGIDPEVLEWSQSPFWGSKVFSERLRMMQIFIAGEIAAFEFDCTGSSRKAHLLTDDFKSSSDLVRVASSIRRLPKMPTSWVSAGPGRPVDETVIRGDDFPAHGPGA